MLFIFEAKKLAVKKPIKYPMVGPVKYNNPIPFSGEFEKTGKPNIPSNKYQTNSDIGASSKRLFDKEVEKYCYMWKEGGQFSTKKYNSINS